MLGHPFDRGLCLEVLGCLLDQGVFGLLRGGREVLGLLRGGLVLVRVWNLARRDVPI